MGGEVAEAAACAVLGAGAGRPVVSSASVAFGTVSWEAALVALDAAEAGGTEEQSLVAALGHALEALPVATPPAVAAALPAALRATLRPAVRRLAAKHVARRPREAPGEALQALAEACCDAAELDVASAAHAALVAAVADGVGVSGTDAGETLRARAAGARGATPRLRALALGVALAAAGAAGVAEDLGLLKGLLAQDLDGRDLLAALAALELVGELADGAPAAAAALLEAGGVGERVAGLAADQAADPMLRGGAVVAAGRALAASPGTAAGSPLLAVVAAALEDDATRDSAIDAVGRIATGATGVGIVLGASGVAAAVAAAALGRSGRVEARTAATHALATVAGAERPPAERVLEDAAAEDALRDAVFGAVSGSTLPEVLHALLRKPGDAELLEARVAVYRLLSALGARPWCAAEVLAHAPLAERLCDPGSEAGQRACEWRFAAVSALCAGAPSSERLAAARAAGPYGRGVSGTDAAVAVGDRAAA